MDEQMILSDLFNDDIKLAYKDNPPPEKYYDAVVEEFCNAHDTNTGMYALTVFKEELREVFGKEPFYIYFFLLVKSPDSDNRVAFSYYGNMPPTEETIESIEKDMSKTVFGGLWKEMTEELEVKLLINHDFSVLTSKH